MPDKNLNIVILGLSLSSSWGNGHATTYRSLIKGLYLQGHRVTFLERDKPWYSSTRDFQSSPNCTLHFYSSVEELRENFSDEIRDADAVIVGSYTPDGVSVGEWVTDTAEGVTAFYDIDTPVTLEKLENDDFGYLHPRLIPKYDIYLSFTGGPILKLLENKYHSPSAKTLYCSVDTDFYYPDTFAKKWTLGYLGTYSPDRQPALRTFLIGTAKRLKNEAFVVAGPRYPDNIYWPLNIKRIDHLAPGFHVDFYNSQQYTLNITRSAMIQTGYAPSVRLFEAAACGVPVISDYWNGLETIFEPDEEILIAASAADVMRFLNDISEEKREQLGEKARHRILSEHSHLQRAEQLASYIFDHKKIETIW